MSFLYHDLEKEINKRKNQGNYRNLNAYEGFLDFFSNDYLGLSAETTFDFSKNNSGSSRLIAGTTSLFLEAEKTLANHFKSPAALIFNSGYAANLGFLSAIPKRETLIIYDELCHASIKDGMRLSLGKSVKFKHNNLQDLHRLLEQFKTHSLIIVIESLYSMHGDLAPIKEITQLAKAHQAFLYIDEAHSGGVFGQNGRGLTGEELVFDIPHARLISFGKAFGSHGAVLLTDTIVKDYLINFSRPFIYTTALPEANIAHALNNILSSKIHEKQKQLQQNITYFRENLHQRFVLTADALSPIQIIQPASLEELQQLEQDLLQVKIGVKAIYSPTVPLGSERLRISIHANHSKADLDRLLSKLN